MKKYFVLFFTFLFCLKTYAYANNLDISGRWAEKISERVVMDVYPDKKDGDYHIFITWREDNLAQKDIYRFFAKSGSDNELKYENGIHIYRNFSGDKFEDKIDYIDGSGIFKIVGNEILWIDNKDNNQSLFIRANNDLYRGTTIKNRLFSITLPQELKGLYSVEVKKDKISVYDIASSKSGFGGFAFGIKAYKNPFDHATLPGSVKTGELRDAKGGLYDVVLKHPTDVQYDYTKNSQAPYPFKLLYDIGDVINIKGVKGSEYFKNQGMKGKDLYNDVIRKHITAINEKWDSAKLEKENMSYMYNVSGDINRDDLLNRFGYAYYDMNADGVDELVIGEISEGNWKGVVYDIYTMVNREPRHVISGGSRNRYYVCDDVFVCNEYSSGALESGVRVYALLENSTELFPQVSFKYDAYANPQKPWFLSYGFDMADEKWENISEDMYIERKKVFDKYERFDFIPFSQFK